MYSEELGWRGQGEEVWYFAIRDGMAAVKSCGVLRLKLKELRRSAGDFAIRDLGSSDWDC